MSEKFSPEFLAGVQLQTALMGLSLAFKKKYGDEALKVTQAFAEQMGTSMGKNFKEKANIAGSGIRDIERVFHIWLDPAVAPHKVKTTVEGKKLTVTREKPTMCPAMVVAKQMKLPLKTVCNNIALPMFKRVAKAFNLNAKHSTVQMTEQKCIDIIEIP